MSLEGIIIKIVGGGVKEIKYTEHEMPPKRISLFWGFFISRKIKYDIDFKNSLFIELTA
ncbi:hypothetical protein ACFX5F_11820 [Flavobacterium sp. ZS1P70]|uniref:Uncharacterized protein n=1 Tax=Flavobacterium zhoui TaxID=3230414 RepID=A0ABW6I7D3_9FLAO